MKMLKLYLDWRKSIVKENHFVNNHLFLDKRGNGVPQHELQQAFRLICTKANIVRKDGKNVRLHDLRHSFATHRLVKWYKKGADVQTLLPVLSTYLGHSHLEGNHSIFRYDNFIGCFSADKIKMSARK